MIVWMRSACTAIRVKAISLLVMTLTMAVCPAVEVYTLPSTWNGTKVNATNGNPALINGVALWRLDAVVSPDPALRPDWEESLHYTPLSWAKDCWRYDLPQYQGVTIKPGELTVAAYGVGQGEFCKNNVLVFLVPKDGTYTFNSTIDVFCWEGGVTYDLMLLKKEMRQDALRLSQMGKFPLEIKKGNEVASAPINLRKGSELIILPNHQGNYSGAAAIFKGLQLTRVDIAGGYKDTLGPSREPAQRASAPMALGNPTGFNFPLCALPVNAEQKDGRPVPGLHATHHCLGIIDVTKPPYNADNTGKSDVSDVLTQALRDSNSYNGFTSKIVYLPDGIYLVSKTIAYRDPGSVGPCFQGQSRAGTIIRLKDGTWPTATNERRWVLKTGSGVAQNFNRIVRNMTINIGRDNDGASGLFFYGNNQSSMSDITIISEDGKGQVGLDLCDGEQGPCLVKNTLVRGFKVGVTSDALNAVTFHNLSLEGQTEVGFKSLHHEQWIYGLKSMNRVPVIDMTEGAVVVVNAELSGGDSSTAAIKHQRGMLFVRNATASGYRTLIESVDKQAVPPPVGLRIEEYSSGAGQSLFGAPQSSLNLPVKEPTEPAWEQDMSKWASVEWYKRDGLTDAEALQAAIDDKRNTTICVPENVRISGTETVYVRGSISRIIGTGGGIVGMGKLVVSDGDASVVKIERLGFPRGVYHRSARTLVIESVVGPWFYHEGAGDVFITDVALSVEVNHPKAHLWCWQFNSESQAGGLTLKAGTAWVFGWKTEGTSGGRVLATGGTLEILGFLVYTALTDKSTWPLIELTDTACSIAGVAQITFGDADKVLYHRLVKETKKGVTKELTGTSLPLYSSAASISSPASGGKP